MPLEMPIVTTLIILVTTVVSFLAFKDEGLREKLIFRPRAVLADKEYYRLFSSALLHADWEHLIFNMLTLYFFGRYMELVMGPWHFLLIYLVSILGGGLVSLYLHRNHEYAALGASGGVCGVLFSYIFLFPGSDIMILFIPFGIPAWLYAIVFLVSEFTGLRGQRSNIGHDAHLGGAIIGLLTTTAMHPEIIGRSPWLYTAVLVLSGIMFVYLWKNPLYLPRRGFFDGGSGRKVKKEKPKPTAEEIDAVLEKVSRHGIQSLSERERRILQDASRK